MLTRKCADCHYFPSAWVAVPPTKYPFRAASAIAPGTVKVGSAIVGVGLLSAYVSGGGAARLAAGPGKTSPGLIGRIQTGDFFVVTDGFLLGTA